MESNASKETVKAYVDFSEFNKVYADYKAKNGQNDAHIRNGSDDLDKPVVLDRRSSDSSNQSEEWEILKS